MTVTPEIPGIATATEEPTPSTERPDVDEVLYLKGRPTLKNYIRFVRHNAVDVPGEGALTDEWREASEIVRDLQKTEAGAADDPPIEKVGMEYEPLLIEFLKDPLVRNGFETVPTQVAFIELDRLVVWQKHIDLTFVQKLVDKLPENPSDEDVFRACLLHDRPDPAVKWGRHHSDSYVFMSESNDLRFLGTMKLEPRHIRDYPFSGDVTAVIGLAVGFGSNFMNAYYAKKQRRLILNNGSHRAFALRSLGLKRVPCIVQHVASLEEMKHVGPSEVRENPRRYLRAPRPPMLKDYFNPDLRTVMKAHRRHRQVMVKFSVDEGYVPAL